MDACNRKIKLERLLEGIDYNIIQGGTDRETGSIHYNTKDVMPGGVFVCIKGFHTDSHKLVKEAVYNGATVIVCEDIVDVTLGVTLLQVADTRKALAKMSSNYFDNPAKDMIMIGVTGTKGKTTITYMIRGILSAAGIQTGIIGSIETSYGIISKQNENTTPESYEIWKTLYDMKNAGMKAVVMEVSSQGLMLERVYAIHFDYGIFTNISHDHIGKNEHESLNEYIKCKARLFEQCDLSVINKDDMYSGIMANSARGRVIYYGMPSGVEYVMVNKDGKTGEGDMVPGMSFVIDGFKYMVSLGGVYSVYNAVAAKTVCDSILFMDEKETVNNIELEVLSNLNISGRMEYIKRKGLAGIIIDYAHNALALSQVLKAVRRYTDGNVVCVFGCGGNRSKLRRYEMGQAAAKYSDYIIVTSDNPRYEDAVLIMEDIEKGILMAENKRYKAYKMIEERKTAVEYALSNSKENDIIVVAGKGHEKYQEIRGRKYNLCDRDIVENY